MAKYVKLTAGTNSPNLSVSRVAMIPPSQMSTLPGKGTCIIMYYLYHPGFMRWRGRQNTMIAMIAMGTAKTQPGIKGISQRAVSGQVTWWLADPPTSGRLAGSELFGRTNRCCRQTSPGQTWQWWCYGGFLK